MVRSALPGGEAGFDWPPKAATPAEQFLDECAERSAEVTVPPADQAVTDIDALRRRILAKSASRAETPPAAATAHSRWDAVRRRLAHARTWVLHGVLLALVGVVVLQAAYIFQLRSRPITPAATTLSAGTAVLERAPATALPSPNVTTASPSARARELPAVQAPPARGGRLSVKSDPPGAQVIIDGRPYGVTPLALGNVTPGDRHVVIRRGAQEARYNVRIEPGTAASLIVPLTAASGEAGWLSSASPIELDLFEAGTLIGTSRSRQLMLPTGRHTIELINEQTGFRRTEDVWIEAGKVTTLNVVPPLGVIHLNATPWADVWIDGEAVGQTPIGNHSIPIGVHEIVFRHPVFGERVLSTVVRADAAARLSADMRRGAGDRR